MDHALPPNSCFTFVRGRTPDEVIARLGGGRPVSIASGPEAFAAQQVVQQRIDEHGAAQPSRLGYVAVTQAGEWAMVVEPNGFGCTRPEWIRALDAELFAFFAGEHSDPQFVWARRGEILVSFDPGYPDEQRWGSDPGRLDAPLRELGFHDGDEEYLQRTLALLERLTGVRWDAGFLARAAFRCAAVAGPGVPFEPWHAEVRDTLAASVGDPEDWNGQRTMRWFDFGIFDRRVMALGEAGRRIHQYDGVLALRVACAPGELRERVVSWLGQHPAAGLRRAFPELDAVAVGPAPPLSERPDIRRKLEALQRETERYRREDLERTWGGRVPADRRLFEPEVQANALGLLPYGRDLIDRIAEAGPDGQRAMVAWAAQFCRGRADITHDPDPLLAAMGAVRIAVQLDTSAIAAFRAAFTQPGRTG
ncbi:DUF6461 domain-containing protein [Dactylosporangium sp. CS-033363]|uniref:DUF6461 domain-containing protein n=1 Tax=Dactylosporangium sp. CS-033363 TaxID=3239935 RepID=UPI003D93A3EC